MSSNPKGSASRRLARWLEARESGLLKAGAGAGTAADRRLTRAVLVRIRFALSETGNRPGKANPDARVRTSLNLLAASDPVRFARVAGALRDRTLALLRRSRSREAPAFRRLAVRAFDALLAEKLCLTRPDRVRRPGRGDSARAPANGTQAPLLADDFEKIFGDAEQAVLVFDSAARIVFSNRALQKWYGYSGRELGRMKVTDLIAVPYRKQFPPLLRKVLAEKACTIEAIHVRKNGSPLEVSASGWVLSAGRTRRVICILKDITEKKRVERDLGHVLSGAECLLWEASVTARGGGFTWKMSPMDDTATGRFLPLTLRRGETCAHGWLRARPDGDVVRLREGIEKAIREKRRSFSHEFRCVDAAGKARWIHEDVLVEPLEKRHFRICALCTDVTQQREGEKALLENIARFQKVFEEGPLGMAIIGLDYSFQSVNATLCGMLGYTMDELKGMKFTDITHPDDLEKDLGLAEKVFRGEIPHYAIEKRYLKKNGDIQWANLSATVVRNKENIPIYGLAMLEDISERRQTSEMLERRVSERTRELTESLRRNETILRTALDGFLVIDPAGYLIEANEAYLAMTGWEHHEIVGKHLSEIDSLAGREVIARSIKELRGSGGKRFETRHRRKDGSQINVEVSATYSPGMRGGEIFAFVRDVSESREAARQLQESEEKFRKIFENAPILIDSFDENGRCVLWNKECERTLGWSMEEVRAAEDPLALAYPDPEVRDGVLETIRRADGVFREYEVSSKSGARRVQIWADFRLPNKSIISTGLDITERKQAENALRNARDDLERRVSERTAALRHTVGTLEREVAERERVEDKLRDSEAKLTALIDNATEAIWSVDTEGKLVTFNSYFHDEFLKYIGIGPQAGKTLDELMRDKRFRRVRRYLRAQTDRALAGDRFTAESIYRVGAVTRYYILSFQPIVSQGVIQGATAYTKDITDLKIAERALAQRLEFEKLIARISQAFLNIEPDGFEGVISETLEAIGHHTAADRSHLTLFSGDMKYLEGAYEWTADGVEPKIDRIRRLPPGLFPSMIRKLMGEKLLIISRLSELPPGTEDFRLEVEKQGVRSLLSLPLLSKRNLIGILSLHAVRGERTWPEETRRLLSIAAEIIASACERARAQTQLAALSRRNQLILESAGEGIFGLDAAGRATFVNPAAARMMGRPPQEIIGKPVHGLIRHSHQGGTPYPPDECPIHTVLRDGEARRSTESLFLRKDGTGFPVEFISNPLREGGHLVGAVVTFKDITERKRSEADLRRVVEGTSSVVGRDFFRSLVRHLAAALQVRFAFVAECIEGEPDRARILAFWNGDEFGEPIEYEVGGTPCQEVFSKDRSYYPSGVRERFPRDHWLDEIGAESYLAVALYDSNGAPAGHLGVLDDGPMEVESSREPILRIFAARAGAEVERKRAEESLRHQAEMDQLIGAISKRFINVAPGEMDGPIDEALKMIGIFSGVDRSHLFRFSEDLLTFDNSNEWCAEDIPSQLHRIRNAPTGPFPWGVSQLVMRKTLNVRSLDDLPPEAAAERAEWEARGIKSLLAVPILSRSRLIGFVGLESVCAERAWSQQTVRLLELLSEIISNALTRDRAELEFKKLSRTNELILYAAGEGIYGLDLEGRVTFANPAAARMLGWDAEALLREPMHRIIHHTRHDGTAYPVEDCPIVKAAVNGRQERIDEEIFWRKDGTSFPVEYISTPIREKDRIIGNVVTFNDITLRKRAEEDRYQAQLLGQLPDAVFVMDAEGVIRFWSKGAENLTGYPAGKMIRQSFGPLLSEADPGGGLRGILKHLSRRRMDDKYQGEHLLRSLDGRTRLVALHLHPSPGAGSKGKLWIGIAQDITEARSKQEEMLQASRLAEVGILAAGVAHEINNPLTVLSGNIQKLLERAPSQDPDRPRFERMQKVCDRISEVVGALGRVSAKKGDQWSLVAANEVIEESLLLIEQLYVREGVKLVRRYTPDLPRLRLLQNGLQQVTMNIVMNAIDAIEDRGEVTVETSRGRDFPLSPPGAGPDQSTGSAPSVRIRITDTGPGIPEKEIRKIFLPFFTTKEPGKGTGLGLAVARSIVSIHRGSIEVESKEGRGTTFTITLPGA